MIDKFHYPRKIVVSAVCASGFLGSLIFTANSGLFWVDILDHFITHYGLVIVAILECVLVGWIFKASRLREHINHAGGIVMSRLWNFSIRFLTPGVLVGLLIHDVFKEVSNPYEGYPWGALIGIGHMWLAVALVAAFLIAMRPWKRVLKNDY